MLLPVHRHRLLEGQDFLLQPEQRFQHQAQQQQICLS